jgi:hypothetical protein
MVISQIKKSKRNFFERADGREMARGRLAA